ncbi:pyridoxal phosphate-dependent aminotransferase [Microbacterium sp. NPDC078428]|uniref:pyridoxal phosphate-dependent aminotransferase n=1 Tax=Microbacterium sp. NPDC078428 TaxID=3364190 RepID=UPI0037C6627A
MTETFHVSESPVSRLAADYPPSGIRAVFEQVAKYDNVVKLTVGEPDFDTPEHIIEAGVRALRDGNTRYTPNGGSIPLRQAIARKYSAAWSRPFTEENVMITLGGAEGLLLSFMASLEPGDEVLVPDPGFPSYEGQAHLIGAIPVRVPLAAESGFKMTADLVAPLITERTRALVVNAPSNPLGTTLSQEEFQGLIDLSKEHGFTIISDEVYDRIVYDGKEHVSVAKADPDFDNYLIINSFSKSYAMTGWRLGYVIGPKRFLTLMPRMQEGVASCVPGFIQEAGLAAIEGPDDDLHKMVTEYQKRRDLVVDGIRTIDGLDCATPGGAFYAFVDIRATGKTSAQFATQLLEEQRVAVVPGTAFGSGGEGFLRLSYAASEDTIRAAIHGFAEFMKK